VWGQGGEMTQDLYAHINNKTIKKIEKIKKKIKHSHHLKRNTEPKFFHPFHP
jgi:hypothetical protein